MPSLIVLFHGIENLVPQLLMLSVLPGLIEIGTLFLSFSQLSRASAKDKGNQNVYSAVFAISVRFYLHSLARKALMLERLLLLTAPPS